jgi:hypothetical protein
VEVTVNCKEENSKNFCPNYVLEFGLRALMFTVTPVIIVTTKTFHI